MEVTSLLDSREFVFRREWFEVKQLTDNIWGYVNLIMWRMFCRFMFKDQKDLY